MIALIPARGGSKGLSNKNVRLLDGKPLIAYSIEAALQSKSIERVIVSTDSEEIAEVAKAYGAEVPWLRPKHLAGDDSKAIETYLHAITWIHGHIKAIDSICILLPTSPLRTSHDIDKAISLFDEKQADSIISYTKEHHPITWHKYIKEDLTFENIFDDELNNRQDMKISYFPNGSIYVFKVELLKKNLYYSSNSYAYLMPRCRSVDIDFLDDFLYAEFLIKNQT